MGQDTAERATLNATAQALLRLVIGSYFLAVALGLIPGTDLSLLFSGVLPPPFDEAVATGLVFLLAFMVMVDYATRVAALVMALITFYASYLAMISLGVAEELGSFWRDLALIAALLLTYSEPSRGRPIAQDDAYEESFSRRLAQTRTEEALAVAPVLPRRVRPLSREEAELRARRPAPALDFETLYAQATAVLPPGMAGRAITPRRPVHAETSQREAGWSLSVREEPLSDDAGEYPGTFRPLRGHT